MKISHKENQILEALSEDDDIANIAQKLRMPRSTLYYHVNKLKKKGVIKGYRVDVHYSPDTANSAAFVLISLDDTREASRNFLLETLRKSRLVREIYLIAGDWDFIVLLDGERSEINMFIASKLTKMKNVKKTHSLFIVSQTML